MKTFTFDIEMTSTTRGLLYYETEDPDFEYLSDKEKQSYIRKQFQYGNLDESYLCRGTSKGDLKITPL